MEVSWETMERVVVEIEGDQIVQRTCRSEENNAKCSE